MSYRSAHSPSFKMDNRQSYKGKPSFSLTNIIGDPFALATISISILAWLTTFIASIISAIHKGFPNFAWWAVVYMFLCISLVTVSVAMDTTKQYQIMIVGFLAAGLVFTTSSVNSLVYSSVDAFLAAAAGFILLSMISIVWIFYFGQSEDAPARSLFDDFAINKKPPRNSHPMSTATHMSRPATNITANQPSMYTSAQLNGFENPSPVFSGAPAGAADGTPAPRAAPQSQFGGSINPAPMSAAPDGDAPAEYPYRAKAIYSYDANPDDINEISFAKHEILKVSDVSGRWWQAQKESGETGIAPSNYLILL